MCKIHKCMQAKRDEIDDYSYVMERRFRVTQKWQFENGVSY